MECARGFIGIRAACSPTTPASGLYIEDLEGIDVPRIQDVNSGKWKDSEQAVEEKLLHAARLVLEEVRMGLEPIWIPELILETGIGGKFDASGFSTPGATPHGLRVRMVNNSIRVVRLNEIFLEFEDDFSEIITVTDGITTVTFNDAEEVIAPAGIRSRLEINFTSSTGIVEITYPGSGIRPRTGSTSETYLPRDCGHCGSSGYEAFTVRGYSNGTETTELYGIAARISVECAIEKALCLVLHHLKMPILYRLGIELLKEWEASSRMNFMTIHSKDWAKEKRAEWEEITYPRLMNSLLPGVGVWLKRVDKNCLNCGGLTYGYSHP